MTSRFVAPRGSVRRPRPVRHPVRTRVVVMSGRLPEDVYRALKAWAVADGCSIGWALEQAVRAWVGLPESEEALREEVIP